MADEPGAGAPPLVRQESIGKSEARKAFDLFDLDKSGYIDADEFVKLVNYPDLQSAQRAKLTDEEIKIIFHKLDKSGDNQISFEEFFTWWSADEKPAGGSRQPSLARGNTQLTFIKKNMKQRTFIDNVQRFGMKDTFYCQLCFEYQLADENSIRLGTCGHRYCKECLRGYLVNQVENGQVYPNCFADTNGTICKVPMAEADVLSLLPEDVLVKYNKFKANTDNANNRQCPKCDHTQLGDAQVPTMTCEKCQFQYCFVHGGAHPESNCVEYDRVHALEDKQTAAAIAKNCKPCPRCQAPISKNGGCNHMKCGKCKCSFCWLCNKEVEDIPQPSHYKPDPSNLTNPCVGRQMEGMRFGQLNISGWRRCVFFAVFFTAMAILFFITMPLAFFITIAISSACFLCVACVACSGPPGATRALLHELCTMISTIICFTLACVTCFPVLMCMMQAGGCCPTDPGGPASDDNWNEEDGEGGAPPGDMSGVGPAAAAGVAADGGAGDIVSIDIDRKVSAVEDVEIETG